MKDHRIYRIMEPWPPREIHEAAESARAEKERLVVGFMAYWNQQEELRMYTEAFRDMEGIESY